MKKKLTLPLFLIAALGLAYLLATLTLNSLLSEERLRLMLIEPAEAQLGRKIDVGSIDVSLLSGINIGNLKIHGKNPSEDFLSIAAFRLDYKLLPLLHKQLVITELLVDQPSLSLSRDASGAFNFADLSLENKKVEREIPPPEEQTVEPLPLSLIFDKITVSKANLTFTDQTGELPAISNSQGDLNLSLALADKLSASSFRGVLKLIVNADYRDHKPVLILNCDFDEKQASFKGDLSVEFEKIFFNGLLRKLPDDLDLTLNLQSPALDLDKLATIIKPANKKAAPAPPEATPAPPAPALPATPGNFLAHGEIAIARLQQGQLAVQKVNLNYAFKEGQLILNNFNFEIFGGKVASQLKANIGKPVPDFQGEIKTDRLQMAAAMAALGKPAGYLSGDLSAELNFQGAGRNWPEIRQTLSGDGKFSLVKGGLADSPYSRALATILDIPELNDLSFEELAGTLRISEGRVALLCAFSSAGLDLQADGSAGLDGSLDLPLTTRLSPENSRRFLDKSKFAGYLADESGRTTLNLRLSGTVEQPQLAIDQSGTGRQMKKVLEKKAAEELGRALGKQLGGPENQGGKELGEDLSNRLLKQMLAN